MAKRISCTLSVEGIEHAIRELEEYQRTLSDKVEKLQNLVAERIADMSDQGFRNAIVDDLLNGGVRYADVSVEVSVQDGTTLVIASGMDAIFVEFGAGVYHNGSVGSSPHPEGANLGFTIGSYGKGNGAKKVWGYYNEGTLVLTHGTPASMPMYHAVQNVCDEIGRIAEEVFT